jgi:RNA polymerase-binding transcription factor DksA
MKHEEIIAVNRNGGRYMEGNLDYIYNELRETKTELLAYLNNGQKDERILQYILDELRDIEAALNKMENGEYGKCEISGEYLPYDFLQTIPTARSAMELHQNEQYCRKPIYS